MCGRFVSATPIDVLARYFDVDIDDVAVPALPARYNIAPTDEVAVVVRTAARRRLEALRWGLLPFWAKDPRSGAKMINARAGTLAVNNAYRRAFRARRCLVPADGFYEWKRVPGRARTQPVYIRRADGEPMAMAGLWERWRPPDRRDDGTATVRSCTIVTGEPNELVADVHDRMPVLLPRPAWDAWLDPDNHDLEALAGLLVPAPAALLVLHPVSSAVNHVGAEGPELVEPFDPRSRPLGDGPGDGPGEGPGEGPGDDAGGATQAALF